MSEQLEEVPGPYDNQSPSKGDFPIRSVLVLVVAGIVAYQSGLFDFVRPWFGSGLGAPCSVGEECRSRSCLVFNGAGVCSKRCAADTECDDLRCATGHCIPKGNKEFGDYCSKPWECKGGVCLVYKSESDDSALGGELGHCSESCSSTKPCANGRACSWVPGADSNVCK